MRLILILAFLFTFSLVKGQLTVSEQDLNVLVGGKSYFDLNLRQDSPQDVNITLTPQHEGLVSVIPNRTWTNVTEYSWNIAVTGISPGHLAVFSNVTSETVIKSDEAYVRVTVLRSHEWNIVSIIVGWAYFVAWSISFYPQLYENWRRKSVVGLNFDFVALNLLGFIMYSLFNGCLYWIPEVKEEYLNRHPMGLLPVLINDIVFSFHATFAVVITILQCCIYERGGQRISIPALVLFVIYFIFILTSIVLASVDVIHWLDFLYYCSYVKLTITIIKYIPQAYMNYRRKSTIGWSIGNIFLDFTGGVLSMGQMILNSWNFNDWASIFGDPTKFGLGLFSVVFDIFFMSQHYCCYRKRHYAEFDGDTITGSNVNIKSEVAS